MINSDQLQSLSLEYNRLTSLTRNFLPVSVKLRKLKLAENPWTCDCRLLHLRELQVSTPSSQDTVCNLIPDLTCAPEISIEAISRPPGIQCKVSSWPRPWVKWSKDGVELDSSSYVMESEDDLRALETPEGRNNLFSEIRRLLPCPEVSALVATPECSLLERAFPLKIKD